MKNANDWKLTLDPSTAEKARDTALNVVNRIVDTEKFGRAIIIAPRQSPAPEFMRWEPHSLGRGNAGLAVLLGYVDAVLPNQGWDHIARQHIEAAVSGVRTLGRVVGPSLFGGLSGIAFAAWYLSRDGRRYKKLIASIDQALLPLATDLARGLCSNGQGVSYSEYDLISGISGIGAYLLCRVEDPQARFALEIILKVLTSLAEADCAVPKWHTPARLSANTTMNRDNPIGVLNCGLSHGIPGPLALLAVCKIRNISVPGMESAIAFLADWLSQNRVDDEWGINWPSVFPLALAKSGELEISATRQKPTHAAWCYGTPGVARSLWLAGVAIEQPRYCDLAVEAMRVTVTKPKEYRSLSSPTFCHGISGLLHITARFASDTRLPIFTTAVEELIVEVQARFEPDSILGYRSIERGGVPVDNPGFLDGAPGVALALLAATCSVAPEWDRLFLLS